MTTLPTASIWDLQAGSDPGHGPKHLSCRRWGTGNKLDPTLLRVTMTFFPDQRLPAGPCHAEGTRLWHPPPEGGVQPGAACRHCPAGGLPGRRAVPASVPWVPSTAGILLAGAIVRDLIG